jgi:hypothetical protein
VENTHFSLHKKLKKRQHHAAAIESKMNDTTTTTARKSLAEMNRCKQKDLATAVAAAVKKCKVDLAVATSILCDRSLRSFVAKAAAGS